MSQGGHEIALLSAGGGLVCLEAVMEKKIKNAYALIRPPGTCIWRSSLYVSNSFYFVNNKKYRTSRRAFMGKWILYL